MLALSPKKRITLQEALRVPILSYLLAEDPELIGRYNFEEGLVLEKDDHKLYPIDEYRNVFVDLKDNNIVKSTRIKNKAAMINKEMDRFRRLNELKGNLNHTFR